MHRLALAAGGLTFFIVLAPLQELDAARADDTSGMALVGLAAVFLLVALAARLRAGALAADGAAGASPAGGPG